TVLQARAEPPHAIHLLLDSLDYPARSRRALQLSTGPASRHRDPGLSVAAPLVAARELGGSGRRILCYPVAVAAGKRATSPAGATQYRCDATRQIPGERKPTPAAVAWSAREAAA